MIWWPTEVPTLSYGLITLRPLAEKDIPDIYNSCQDPVIPKFTRVPFDYTLAHAEFFVREKTPKSLIEKTELAFAIEYGNGEDKKFAGVISFHSMDLPDLVAELGYWINADSRGKNIGTTAARMLTNFGFGKQFDKINALTASKACSGVPCGPSPWASTSSQKDLREMALLAKRLVPALKLPMLHQTLECSRCAKTIRRASSGVWKCCCAKSDPSPFQPM